MRPTSKFVKRKASLTKRLPSIAEILDFLDDSDKPFLDEGDRPVTGFSDGLEAEDVWFKSAKTRIGSCEA